MLFWCFVMDDMNKHVHLVFVVWIVFEDECGYCMFLSPIVLCFRYEFRIVTS